VRETGHRRAILLIRGGAARGFAHIGVIRALEQEKLPIHPEPSPSVSGRKTTPGHLAVACSE
jgi:hypothetical protein